MKHVAKINLLYKQNHIFVDRTTQNFKHIKKKYTFENNPQISDFKEPAFNYGSSKKPPCQYSIQEIRKRFDLAVEQVEKGEVFTDDELDNFIFQ